MASNWVERAFMSSILLLVFIAPFGSAIKCYQCKSFEDKVCGGDLPKVPVQSDPAYKYLVDCEKSANRTHLDVSNSGAKSTFCRKIYQDVDGKVGIIRACGFVKGNKACYSTANPPTKTLVCQCEEDGCNSAPGLPITALALPVLACLMYYIRY